MKRILFTVLALVMCVAFITGCGQEELYSGQTNATGGKKVNLQPKPTDAIMDISEVEPAKENTELEADYAIREPEKGEVIAIIHTDFGDIKMRFLDKVAPIACKNFIALAEEGRFDNTIFHRVINSFMIQGGDYTNFDGTGGGSAFGHEFDLEIAEGISNIEGSVAMANRGPGTNGSQFYINQVDNNYLDGGYTVFGWVYEGMDVVDAIANVQTDAYDAPLEPVVISSVEITEY